MSSSGGLLRARIKKLMVRPWISKLMSCETAAVRLGLVSASGEPVSASSWLLSFSECVSWVSLRVVGVSGKSDSCKLGALEYVIGPHSDSTAGRNPKPTSNPKSTITKNEVTINRCRCNYKKGAAVIEWQAKADSAKEVPNVYLQIVMKISVVEKAKGITPNNVVKPPNIIEVPMVSSVFTTFSWRVAPGVS